MSDKRKKVLFLAAIFLLQMLFLKIIPFGKSIDFFPLSKASCTLQEYVYYMMEHLSWIYAFFLMYQEIVSLRREVKIFFWLSVFDFADYLLTYNSVWFWFISFNFVQAIIITLTVITIKDD